MSQPEKAINGGGKVHRSPRYPLIAIDEALEKAHVIYQKDKRAFAPIEVLLGHLGYTPAKHGGRQGRKVVALKHFGLLDRQGGNYRISDLAFKIIHSPADSPERAALIKQAALSPPIMRKVLQYYGGELPSDAALKSHLILNENFNPAAAQDFIKVLRRTLSIVNPSPADYTNGGDSDDDESDDFSIGGTPPMQQTSARGASEAIPRGEAQQRSTTPPPPAGQMHFPLYLSKERQAAIYVPATMSQREFDLLKKQIDHSLLVMEATAVSAEVQPGSRGEPEDEED
jgi:hypothetical protein